MKNFIVSLAMVSLVTACSTTEESSGKTFTRPSQVAVETFTGNEAGFLVTSTLIKGQEDAVLVDAQFTRSQANLLADMITKSGKNLTSVFITHAHPDHYFGLEVLRERFPQARFVSSADVVKEIAETGPGKLAQWKPMYKEDLTDTVPQLEVLEEDYLVLEGQKLPLIGIGAGESEHSNVVYVPSEQTLIAGDNLYNQVHLWLAEGRPNEWLSNLSAIAKLPRVHTIVVGHSSANAQVGRDIIDTNKSYINFAAAEAKKASDAQVLAEKLKTQFSDYKLPVIADISAQTLITH